ncbi:MAG: hypothetical protein RLZZ450_584 [Pseudomonadota bacterium]|jgi:serine/threonine-protein kinase
MVDVEGDCLEEGTVIQLAQGALGASALARAESHLVHCEACRQLVVSAIRTADLALREGATAAFEPPADSVPMSPYGAEEVEVPLPGTILVDKYKVERVLGRGGMGVVLAATHVVLRYRVAIKVLRRAGQAEIARFLREARVSAQLRNRHIVRVHDFGQLPSGAPFLVMEYLEGKDLAQCIELAPLPVRSVVEYVSQACDALSQVHALGIVHRDLKPANLFLTEDQGQLLIKVLDFGIFKTLAGAALSVGEASTQLTGAHALIGSPVYMSPEQLFAREVDARSDIWSLGVILYELLTRELPFGNHNLSALAVAVATAEPTPLVRFTPGIPRALENIVLRCLRKEPGERYRDASELLAALAPLRSAVDLGASDVAPAKSRRRWVVLGGLGAATAGLAIWASASLHPATPASVRTALEVPTSAPSSHPSPLATPNPSSPARALHDAPSAAAPTQPVAPAAALHATDEPSPSSPALPAATTTPDAGSRDRARAARPATPHRTRAHAKSTRDKAARTRLGPTDTPD